MLYRRVAYTSPYWPYPKLFNHFLGASWDTDKSFLSLTVADIVSAHQRNSVTVPCLCPQPCLENVQSLCLCSFRTRATNTLSILRLLRNGVEYFVLSGLGKASKLSTSVRLSRARRAVLRSLKSVTCNMASAWRYHDSYRFDVKWIIGIHGCWFLSSFHRLNGNTGDWHPNSVSFLCVCTSIRIFNLVEDVSDLSQVSDWGLETQVSG